MYRLKITSINNKNFNLKYKNICMLLNKLILKIN